MKVISELFANNNNNWTTRAVVEKHGNVVDLDSSFVFIHQQRNQKQGQPDCLLVELDWRNYNDDGDDLDKVNNANYSVVLGVNECSKERIAI